MKRIFFLCCFIFNHFTINASKNLFRVVGIDSTEHQYKIRLMRLSNFELFTIYTYKLTQSEIDKSISEGYKKIAIGGCYKLRFEEHLIPNVEHRFDRSGNEIHLFYVDRLEGLYYNSFPKKLFKKNRWRPKNNKRASRKLLNFSCV